jgi:hypothetical protein
MTRNPDKFHLKCVSGERLTVTGSDLGTGTLASFALSNGTGGPLPASFTVLAGPSILLSIAVGYPANQGGRFIVTAASSAGNRETYAFTQDGTSHDGIDILFSV